MRLFSSAGTPQIDHQFLFILSPPYSGSTLLQRILETAPHLSSLGEEGQFLPETEKLMRHRMWDPETHHAWDKIKPIWMKKWDLRKPVLLEKSPPNLVRAERIQLEFTPASFIGLIRNPYAFCEGLARRTVAINLLATNLGADFWVRCARRLLEHRNTLDRYLLLRYEDLTDDPQTTCGTLEGFVPSMGELVWDRSFSAQVGNEYTDRPIANMNPPKIANLKQAHLDIINGVLAQEQDLLAQFGYQLIDRPTRN